MPSHCRKANDWAWPRQERKERMAGQSAMEEAAVSARSLQWCVRSPSKSVGLRSRTVH